MKHNVYRIWLLTGVLLFACGIAGMLLYHRNITDIAAFAAGADTDTIRSAAGKAIVIFCRVLFMAFR